MNIRDICAREIVTIDEAASVHEAASLMGSRHVGALVVTADGAGGRPLAVGIVTDRDLAIEVLARRLESIDIRAGEMARGKLVAVPGGAGVAEAVATMKKAGVRRLLVTEGDSEVIGLLSMDDVVDAIAGELGDLADALRSSIAREAAEHKVVAEPAPKPVFLPQGTPGMPWPAMGTTRTAPA